MNNRDKELAVQCRLITSNIKGVYVDTLQEFADLIRADEREAIAAWLDGEAGSGRIISCTSAAKAIRARGNT
jgi:hypothetical protein